MINTSNEYKKYIRKNRKFDVKVVVELSDNVEITIPKSKLRSFSYDSATSNTNTFDIGAVITGEFNFIVDNIKEEYTEEQFYEAKAWAYVGLVMPSTTEWLLVGVYNVIDAKTTGSLISVQAFDGKNKFSTEYSKSTLTYPATLFQIVQDACTVCGVYLGSSTFDFGDYVVQKRPNDESLTFKDILSYVGQISGHYAVMREDALYLEWYDMSALNVLDGGDSTFSNTDIVDGGDSNFTNTDIIDGNVTSDYFHIYAMSGSPNIALQDITITGIQVKAKGDTSDYGETYLYGTTEYALEIENVLILPGQAQTIANHLGQKIVGLTFRPFSLNALSDPSILAGDCGFVTDRKQRSYASLMTNIAFEYNDYETFGCGAKSKEKKASKGSSESTKLLEEARKEASRQLTTYDIAMQHLTSLIAQSTGMFKTDELQEDGSTIYYTHDKKLMSDSTTRWYIASGNLVEETNNNGTWTIVSGTDKEGNALVKVLTAIGINAEWIKAGTIEGSIIAKNLTMQGGTIDITTSDQNDSRMTMLTVVNSMLDYSTRFMSSGILCSGHGSDNGVKKEYTAGLGNVGLSISKENGTKSNIGYSNITLLSSPDSEGGRVGQFNATVSESTGLGNLNMSGNATIGGTLNVVGTKYRIVKTENYEAVALSAYETPRPTFADTGHGAIGEDGFCYIDIDQIFYETIDITHEYRYFLTKYSQGDLWINKRLSSKSFFVVEGTPGMEFDWKIEAIQKGYNTYNLEKFEENNEELETDYITLASQYLAEYEMELII